MHFIKLKAGLYITDHRHAYCIDFSEFRINIFILLEYKKNSYILQPMESNYKKYASVYTVLSIKLKFNMLIVDNFSSYTINFGGSRRFSFFTGYTMYHALWATGSKYLTAFKYR